MSESMKKGDKTREYLIQCAEQIFANRGYHETQISDITERARVAKGTLYQYFKSKEDIFLNLIKRYYDSWEDAIKINMDIFSGNEPPKYYARMYVYHRIGAIFDFFGENNDRCRIILRMSLGINPFIESLLGVYEKKIISFIIDDIKLGQKWGNVSDEINPEIAGPFIMGAALRVAYTYYIHTGPTGLNLTVSQVRDNLISLILNTLRMT